MHATLIQKYCFINCDPYDFYEFLKYIQFVYYTFLWFFLKSNLLYLQCQCHVNNQLVMAGTLVVNIKISISTILVGKRYELAKLHTVLFFTL